MKDDICLAFIAGLVCITAAAWIASGIAAGIGVFGSALIFAAGLVAINRMDW